MLVALIVLTVLSTVNIAMTFLTLAAAGRVALNQSTLTDAVRVHINELIDRVEELTAMVESAMDCLVTIDARAADTSEVGTDAG